MTDKSFSTSADLTRISQSSRAARLARSITAKRADRFVRPLKEALSRVKEDDPDTPPNRPFGYGLVEMETTRVFREIDAQGRLHVVDLIQADEIDGVLGYVTQSAQGRGFVYPGSFPGNIRDGDDIVVSGRFSGTGVRGNLPPNGTLMRLFTGGQSEADAELVAQTSVDAKFIGKGLAYVWSRFVFQDGKFDGDPTVNAYVRSRRVVDPRDVSIDPTLTFEDLPQRFSINPILFIFDYLVRPKILGGAGLPLSLIDIATFAPAATWAEELVDTQPFSHVAELTTDSNKQLGTPPMHTNHLLEFNRETAPFQYGDVINFSVTDGQTLPANVSTSTDYYVIPVKPAVNDFQFPAVAVADSLENALAGVSVPLGNRVSDITVTKVKEVRLQAGVTWRSGEQVLERMFQTCGCRPYLADGKIAINSQMALDADDVEAVALDELIGTIAVSPKQDNDDRATALSGTHRSLVNLFIPRSYPLVSGGGVFEAQDGERRLRQFNLPFVPKASIAQRLATIELRRRRQEKTLAFSGDLSLYRLTPGKIFSLDFEKYGLDADTTFQVTDQTLALRVQDDAPFFLVNIEARQLELATFDLDLSAEELVEAIRIPGLQNPGELEAPSAIQVAENLYRTRRGSGVKVKVTLTWAPSPSLFLRGYRVSFRQTGNVDYLFLAETPDTRIEIDDLEAGLYDFQVQAVGTTGARSEEAAELTNHRIQGLAAKPATPTGFTGQVIGSASVLLRWTQSVDLDVIEGGSIEILHSPLISGAEVQNSVYLDGDIGEQISMFLPFKQGTYFLIMRDSSGQRSDAASWSTQSRRPVGTAQIPNGTTGVPEDDAGFTLQEDSTFPSTHPDNTLIFDTDHLELPLQDTMDDEADFDAIVDIDLVGGGAVSPEGEYYYSTDLEFDQVYRFLVETVLDIEPFDLTSSLDDEPDFDQIPDVDKVAAATLAPGLVTAEHQIRFSSGTVASDTFGPFEQIDTQYIEARSMQFKVVARTNSETTNLRINQARVRVRRVDL